jgi:hypothetical protein
VLLPLAGGKLLAEVPYAVQEPLAALDRLGGPGAAFSKSPMNMI